MYALARSCTQQIAPDQRPHTSVLNIHTCVALLLQDISERTMMMPQDITDTLKQLGLLQYWKGSHYIAANAKVVEDYWRTVSQQKFLEVDPKYLHWQPLQINAAKAK